MVGSTKRLYRNSKKVRKMRKSKRTISLGKNKTGGSRRRIKGRKLRNSRRRRKYRRNFRSKRRGGGKNGGEDGEEKEDKKGGKVGIQEWPQGDGNLNINIYSTPEHVYYGPNQLDTRSGKDFIQKMKFLDKDGKFPEVTTADNISYLYLTEDGKLLINQEDYYVKVNNAADFIEFIKIPKDTIKSIGTRNNQPSLIWERGENKTNWKLFNFIDEPRYLFDDEQDNILDGGTFHYIKTYEQLAMAMRSSEWKTKGVWKPDSDSNEWPHSLSDVEKKQLKIEEFGADINNSFWRIKRKGLTWEDSENWKLFDFIKNPEKFLPREEQGNLIFKHPYNGKFSYVTTYEELAQAMKSKDWKTYERESPGLSKEEEAITKKIEEAQRDGKEAEEFKDLISDELNIERKGKTVFNSVNDDLKKEKIKVMSKLFKKKIHKISDSVYKIQLKEKPETFIGFTADPVPEKTYLKVKLKDLNSEEVKAVTKDVKYIESYIFIHTEYSPTDKLEIQEIFKADTPLDDIFKQIRKFTSGVNIYLELKDSLGENEIEQINEKIEEFSF